MIRGVRFKNLVFPFPCIVFVMQESNYEVYLLRTYRGLGECGTSREFAIMEF